MSFCSNTRKTRLSERALLGLAFAALLAVVLRVDAAPVSFKAEVAPILIAKCQSCHGPDKAKGKYRVDSFARALKPGAEEFLYRVTTDDEEERMPPEGDPLPAKQAGLLKRWVDEGTKYDAEDPNAPLASILPSVKHPPAPETYPRPPPLVSLAFSSDSQHLYAGGYREILVREVKGGKLLRRIGNLPERIHAIAPSPDGALLAVAGGIPGRLGEVRVLETTSGKLIQVLHKSSDSCHAAAFSPNGAHLATGGPDGSVHVFNTKSWEQVVTFANHSDQVNDVAWSLDGTKLASAGRDHTAKVFDLAEKKRLTSYTGHSASVHAVRFHPEAPDVFTVAADGKLMRWRISDGGTAREYAKYTSPVYRLVYLPANKELATTSGEARLATFHWHDHRKRRVLSTNEARSVALAVSHDGILLADGDRQGQVRIRKSDEDEILSSFHAFPLRR